MTGVADRDESFYTIWCLPTGACHFLEFLYEALELRNDPKSYPKAEITFQTLNTGRILEFQHRNLQWTLTDFSNGLFRSLNILGVFLVVWRLRTLLIIVCAGLVAASCECVNSSLALLLPVACVFQQLPTVIIANIVD